MGEDSCEGLDTVCETRRRAGDLGIAEESTETQLVFYLIINRIPPTNQEELIARLEENFTQMLTWRFEYVLPSSQLLVRSLFQCQLSISFQSLPLFLSKILQ